MPHPTTAAPSASRGFRCLHRLAIAVLVLSSASLLADASEWQAGVAKAVITPKEAMWMAGYASRTSPSEGTLQELYAKAIAFEDPRGQRMVIVTLDLIGVPSFLRENLEQQAAEKFQLPSECLLINASHTHCGPELRPSKYTELDTNPMREAQAMAYAEALQVTIVQLIDDCLARLEPVELAYSHARCGFAMNRRLPSGKGFQNSPYPDGPVDHSVPVLRVQSPSGELRAVLFGYACHNTTLSVNQFCGDYAGYAQEYLEADHPGVVAMFITGCGGDQNPYPRSTIPLCQQHGRSLANAVEAALLPRPRAVHGPLAAAMETVALNFQPLPVRRVLEDRTKSGNRFEAAHARRLIAMLDDGGPSLEYGYRVQVIRFGDDLTLVALAGEVVVDYSLRLKQALPNENLWVAGYSNDVFGYVPSARILKEGGYEGGGAMTYTSLPGPFTADVEERILNSAQKLLEITRGRLASKAE